MARRVVVTGIGVISAIGIDRGSVLGSAIGRAAPASRR